VVLVDVLTQALRRVCVIATYRDRLAYAKMSRQGFSLDPAMTADRRGGATGCDD